MVDVLVTGGAGFIGSNFVRYALRTHPDWHVTTLDKLTYAGRRENLHDVIDDPRHTFVHGDIADAPVSGPLVERANIVVHFAAETHVDRSLLAAGEFIRTDVEGTFVLLEAARRAKALRRFVQISTDEVYGSIDTGSWDESAPVEPNSPYSAAKAGGDMIARAYARTHGLPVSITRCGNNYGPHQFPEKVIPLFVTNLLDGRNVPLYGDGGNVRDWIHVDDHCRGIRLVAERGEPGEIYHIAGTAELTNLELTERILAAFGVGWDRVDRVEDRKGHDRRYSLSDARLRALGYRPGTGFDDGLAETIDWYTQNRAWWESLKP
jgi:dTDP-glucose 4,6-dehydratase